MQRVCLMGELGERFGAEHTYYNLRNGADAIKLLCINMPEFKDYLLTSEENGIGYQVIQGGVDFEYEDLLLPFGERELVIVPVVSGSGGGSTGQILAGVGLVAFAILTAGAGAGFLGLGAGLTGTAATGPLAVGFAVQSGFVLGSAASTIIGAFGASLLLSGVASALSPQPQVPTLGGYGGNTYGGSGRMGSRNRTNGPENVTSGIDGQQSYAYTGAANSVGVGATVPLAYGKVLIGSHLLKSKFQIADESDPVLTSLRAPSTDTIRLGNEILTNEFSDKSGVIARRVYQTAFNTQAYFDPVSAYGVTNSTQLIRTDVQNERRYASLQVYGGYLASVEQYSDFNVALSLENGLYDQAGGTGTTYVDGYISYEIKVYRGTVLDDGFLVAADSATIQGLIFEGQFFGWMHRLELGDIESESIVSVQVEVISAETVANGSTGSNPIYLRLNSVGYQLY
jgi:predicted phage tail protein